MDAEKDEGGPDKLLIYRDKEKIFRKLFLYTGIFKKNLKISMSYKLYSG